MNSNFPLIFTNQTGQNLTAASIVATGPTIDGSWNWGGAAQSIAANEEVKATFVLGAHDTFTSGGTYTVNFILEYTDADGFVETATGSCKGTAS